MRPLDARFCYYLLEGTTACLFQTYLTIYGVYYTIGVGLDPLQIMLLGTVFETTIFLFEVPTGVIADAYSRRLSVLLGLGIIGIALLLEGAIPLFATLLVAQVIGGIGATFISGATEAWITDEIGVEQVGHVFIRAAQIRIIASMGGAILGVLWGSLGLNLPFIVAGIGFLLLTILLVFWMPERGFQPATRRTWHAMLVTARRGIQMVQLRRTVLLPLLLTAFLFGFHSEGYDMLWQTHLLTNVQFPILLPILVWFGILSIVANVISVIFGEWLYHRMHLPNPRTTTRILLGVYGVMALAVMGFAIMGDFVGVAVAFITISALRALSKPLADIWLNQQIQPEMRATMFSLYSQTNSIGEVLGGAPVGAIGKFASLRAALTACGLVLALTLPILVKASKKPDE